MDRPRMRIIDGRPYIEVGEAFVTGKYRDTKPHYERWDDRVWALIADLVRLKVNRE